MKEINNFTKVIEFNLLIGYC